MSSTAKVSISVPDEDLLQWAKDRSERTGVSLSAVFMEAVRIERQMEARRQFLDEMGAEGRPTLAEAAAIRAEWAGIANVDAADIEKSASKDAGRRGAMIRRKRSKAKAVARGAKR